VGLFSTLATGKDAPRLEDAATIDSTYRRYRWSVIVSLTLGYGMAYTCRLGLSVVKKPLIDQGVFTADQLGTIGAAFLYGYGLGKLLNGPLADLANVRRFFPLGLGLSALVNVAMGNSTLATVSAVLWALNGWFQGFLAPASAVAITNWFAPRERGFVYGVWSASHSIGEGVNFVVTAALVTATAWQAAFFGPAVLCIAVALALGYGLKDRPQTYGLPDVARWAHRNPLAEDDAGTDVKEEDHSVPAGSPPGQGQGLLAPLKKLLEAVSTPTVWVIGAASACMYMTRYAVNSWGVLYLQEARGFTLAEAGGLIGLNATAGLLGSPVYGFISDRFFGGRRPPVTLLFGILEIVGLALVYFGPKGDTAILALGFILYGFTLSGLLAVLGGLFAVDILPRRLAGSAMGAVGVFSYIGAGVQEMVSGRLIESGTTVVDGVRHYDFSSAVMFWFGASVVSMLLAASLWKVEVKD